MKMILADKNNELVFPVTPETYRVSYGMKIETINIHTLGDVHIAGYPTLATIKIECLFPAHPYAFIQSGARTDDPYSYVDQLREWCRSRAVLRYIISDTPVNIPVLIEEIEAGEQDGTGDVYATITLREYRELSAGAAASGNNGAKRTTEEAPKTMQTYTVVKGDTLSAICRRFYGDASLYNKLARYNSIANPHLIYAGQQIRLPDKSALQGV